MGIGPYFLPRLRFPLPPGSPAQQRVHDVPFFRRKGDIPQPPPAPIPPPISQTQTQPASSSAAEEPPSSSSCTNLL
ncbi:hypothetical protein PIB30_084633 [Stylosanthes scabra]|uniref:Uncharacterized protein n=1 Tax=Stylosanthes scabra TaxID=79078 RepID=A0ABU6STA7_9FABA|nr:hypothetical protein [Stylosanthes scabra]